MRIQENNMRVLKLLFVVLSILAILIPAVLAIGSFVQRVNDIERVIDKSEPLHTERIKNLDTRIIELEKIAAGTKVALESIQSDIGEMKTDIKEISYKI